MDLCAVTVTRCTSVNAGSVLDRLPEVIDG
jgi:hypothetical protein